MRAYDRLTAAYCELHHLHSVEGLLHWDQATYLPSAAHTQRAAQLEVLAALHHQRATDPALGEWIAAAEGEGLTGIEARNLDLMRRDYRRRTSIPESLASETARATAEAFAAWQSAREADDFERFAPHLEHVLQLMQQRAECLRDGGSLYQALLEDYEPGLGEDRLSGLFPPLQSGLVELAGRIREVGPLPESGALRGDFPIAEQRRLVERLVAAMGFDFDRGRVDTTVHPFCSGNGEDVRLTTRFDEGNLGEVIGSTVHEAGHGLYEQGLDSALVTQPIGASLSMGIHESQSRLWENQVIRSRAGCAWLLAVLRKCFPDRFRDVDGEQVYRAMNVVAPGLIRTDADEVHYNLHILMRWELERGLIAGEIRVAELPGLWRERMEAIFGLEVPSDREGCLQDVHWSSDFGYFPTYTLGNLYAAQFYRAARAGLQGLDGDLAAGRLLPLRDWLRDRIHRHGSRLTQEELVQEVTGQSLSEAPLLDYLNEKFGELYGLH